MRPPMTRRDETTYALHGVEIADPYRWLEDPNHPEVRAWVEEQNRVTFAALEELPARPRIQRRLTELWDYERLGVPFIEGGRIFFSKNDGLQNQAVLYTADALDAPARVLLDPNGLSADGTVALMGMAVSRDGARLAYGLSASGSDWMEWRVRDVATGEDLPDLVRWVRFSGAAFTPDGQGFYYSRYDEPAPGEAHTAVALNQKLCFHRIGTPQTEDLLVYERPDQPEWGFGASVTDDGRYLVVSVWHGTSPRNRLFYRDLDVDGPIVELLADNDAAYHFAGNEGTRFFIHTDLDAPRGRLIEIDLGRPERAAWRELVPQTDDTLQGVSHVGGRFFASYLADAHSRVRAHALDGTPLGDIALPGLGTAVGFGGRPTDDVTFFAYTGFTTPTRIYRHDVAAGVSTLHFAPKVAFDPEAYETRQVFYRSKDGTRVPMFLAHRRGLVADGDQPVYLYGYGGFNIPLTPAFDPSRLLWMELGGVLAVANLRGGGEYGEDWHQAGCGRNRQNVFDDFIAAAEHLVATGLTRPSKIAIAGSSNGGLLVGACLAQRPELFGAALPDVGVLDMLRFHKFTIGWAWISDYGSPDDPDDFQVLRAYSPLHNLRPGAAYPPTLITTADTDDRVVSAHSYKFAAALQAAQGGPAPILLRVDVKAGHGAGKPTAKVIAVNADRLAWLTHVLGMTLPA
jgi:prolyl oligopeptidase